MNTFQNNEWKIGRVERVFKDKIKVHLINEHWKNDMLIPKDSCKFIKFSLNSRNS